MGVSEYRKILINRKNFLVVSFGVVFLLFVFISGAIKGAASNDFFALMRSLVLGYFVYCFCALIPYERRRQTLYGVSFFVWIFVFISIVAGSITGYGLYTYADHSSGYKFFYPSLNELNFVFFASFLVLIFVSSNAFVRLFYVLATMIVFLILGNKSFVALFAVSLCCYCWLRASFIWRICIFLLLSFLVVLLFCTGSVGYFFELLIDFLIYILSEFSSGSSKLAIKLSYLSPVSALISERDALFLIARDIYVSSYGWYETVLGAGFTSYGYAYGALRGGGEFSFSEIDLVDVFMSYGVVGVVLLLSVMLSVYRRGCELDDGLYMLRRILVVLFVVAGSLTGHIYLMGFPIFFFSCYAGLCSSGSRGREM